MAKSYLNDFNTWVRFEINLPALSPVYFDTPIYVPENGEDSLPRAAMHVKMRYPKIVADYARRIETTMTQVYVLGRDLDAFMQYVRLFDFALCERVQPGDDLRDHPAPAKKGQGGNMTRVHGVSYKIEVRKNLLAQQCRPLLESFRGLHGPLHDCAIIGAPDAAHASSIVASIRDEPGGLVLNPNHEEQALLMLRLKTLGDQHYLNGHYRSALVVYSAALMLDPTRSKYHDKRPAMGAKSTRVVFCTAMKNALTRTMRANALLTMIKYGGHRKAEENIEELDRILPHGTVDTTSVNLPNVSRGLIWIAMRIHVLQNQNTSDERYDELVSAVPTLQSMCGPSLPASFNSKRLLDVREGWRVIQNGGWGRIFTPLEKKRSEVAIAWASENDIPLAHWAVQDSQMPAAVME
jgi:hypothetical protein